MPAFSAGIWTARGLTLSFVLLWQVLSFYLPPYLLPAPLAVAQAVVQLFGDASFYRHAALSIWHVVGSILVAFVIGLTLALIGHFLPVTQHGIYNRLNLFLSSFSTIGWTFLALMWFGLNDVTVMFAVSITLLPFALSNLRTSLEQLDSDLVEMASSFGRSRPRLLKLLILPLMVPYIFATLRICLGVSWKVVLTAELFGGTSGLGYLVSRARANMDVPKLFAIIVVIVCFVYVTDKYVLEKIQGRLRKNHAATGNA